MQKLPAPVEEIIEWWLPQVRDVLGGQLASVVLYGSVTLGDFQFGWSDIDACVVVNDHISEETGKRLGNIHDLMRTRYLEQRHNDWKSGQILESNYIPVTLASTTRDNIACYIAGGKTRSWRYGDPFQPFDRYMLANYGQLYFGTNVNFVVPSVNLMRLQAQADIHSFRAWEGQSAMWLTGMLHWFARSLVFWRDGKMLSKTAALRHEIERRPDYVEALYLALNIRLKGSYIVGHYVEELKSHYSRFVDSLSKDLLQHIGNHPTNQFT